MKIKNKIEKVIGEYKYFKMITLYDEFIYEVECIKNWYECGNYQSDEDLIVGIDLYLKEEENKLRYGAPFSHKNVKQDEKGRCYIISDHSRRRDKKFYLKHYPINDYLQHMILHQKKKKCEKLKIQKILNIKCLYLIFIEKKEMKEE